MKTGDIFNEQVALGHPHETIKLIAEGDRIFSEMIDMLDALGIRKGKKLSVSIINNCGIHKTPFLAKCGRLFKTPTVNWVIF